MKKFRYVFVYLLFFGFIFNVNAESGLNDNNWKQPKNLLKREKGVQLQTRPVTMLIKGKLANVYSANNKVIFSHDNKTTVLDDRSASANIWLEKEKENIYVFWWRKIGTAKFLYFSGSNDFGKTFQKPVKINGSTGILPTLSIVTRTGGKVAIAYLDERQQGYQIYVNSSSDAGKTWQEGDQRLDKDIISLDPKTAKEIVAGRFAVDPKVIFTKDGLLHAFWQQRKFIDKKLVLQVVERVSEDNGLTWGKEIEVYREPSGQTFEYSVSTNGKNIIVLAALPAEGLKAFSYEESKWEYLGALKGTQNTNEISWLRAALNDDFLKVVYTIARIETGKYSVEAATISLAEKKWNDAIFRLDRGKISSEETKALYPEIDVLENGEFLVVWQDYRSITSAIYMDYTIDNGKTWQLSPIPLTRGGLSEYRYPKVLVEEDAVWILSEGYNLFDSKSLPSLSYQKVPYDNETQKLTKFSATLGQQPQKEQSKALLKKRVETLLEARLKKEWEKEWNMLDPVFKRTKAKEDWLSKRGKIIIESYKLKDMSIDGNFAKVQFDVKYKLPKQRMMGQELEESKQLSSGVTMKWIWFHDNWYFNAVRMFDKHLSY